MELLPAWWLLPAILLGVVLTSLFSRKQQSTLAQQLQHTIIQLAVAEQKLTQLTDKENECRHLQLQLSQLQAENADLNARQQEQHKNNAEKIRLLQDTEAQLKTQFENLAHKIFEERGKQFAEHNKLSIENLVAPLKQQIGEFKSRVEHVYDNETKDRISLREEIVSLRRDTAKMNLDALNLTKALKGDHKLQGNWG